MIKSSLTGLADLIVAVIKSRHWSDITSRGNSNSCYATVRSNLSRGAVPKLKNRALGGLDSLPQAEGIEYIALDNVVRIGLK